MTPVVKQVGHTVLRMERKRVAEVSGPVHEAGGDHKGIVISKSVDSDSSGHSESSSFSLPSFLSRLSILSFQCK